MQLSEDGNATKNLTLQGKTVSTTSMIQQGIYKFQVKKNQGIYKYVCYGLSASQIFFFTYNRANRIYYIQIEYSKYMDSIMFSFVVFIIHYIKSKEVYFKEDLFTKKKEFKK